MKIILLITLLFIASCTHKIIAKNCDPVSKDDYWVCDSVFLK